MNLFRTGFLMLSLLVPSALWAGEGGGEASILVPRSSMVSLSLSGAFRMRTEFSRDLDYLSLSGRQRFGIPAIEDGQNLGVPGANWRDQGDFRLRLKPTLNVGDSLTLNSWIDAPGGILGQGQTQDPFLTMTGISSAAGAGDAFERGIPSVEVQALWAQYRVFNFVDLLLGRVPQHWGLGLLENDADGLWSDGGVFLDTFTAVYQVNSRMRLAASWDFPLEGRNYKGAQSWPYSQALDAGDMDELYQFRFKLQSGTGSFRDSGPGLSWGAYARIRWQDFSSAAQEAGINPWCGKSGDNDSLYPCTELYYRDGVLFTPDLWAAWRGALAGGQFGLGIELAANLGGISATQRLSLNDSSKEIYSGAAVGRASWEDSEFLAMLDGGVASGDGDADAFGVLDSWTASTPDDSSWQGSGLAANRTLTAFVANPAFLSDSVLFKYMLGALSSSAYVQATVERAVWGSRARGVSARARVLYGVAMASSQAPGGAAPLALEAELGLKAAFDGVHFTFGGTSLLPLAGLKPESVTPEGVFLVRSAFEVLF